MPAANFASLLAGLKWIREARVIHLFHELSRVALRVHAMKNSRTLFASVYVAST